ncbi:ABC transporter substrate-binding protein [Actinomadura physcomitrii]|uniref:ABC transporter substrate-binding protein n=1 Tax=Actinomadura physcomitrii TaxID=2650748 RepID=UPI001368F6C0|nr:ABC transporter substrate-binding protein [Actinomadura physcomitrii]
MSPVRITPGRTIRTGAAALALITLSACGGGGTGKADSHGPFRVLAVLPLSGALAEQAKLQMSGLQAAADDLNGRGGIGGRKIEIASVDDKLNPTEAVSRLQSRLNGSERPDYVLAGATSNETLAMLPALTNARVLSGTTASDRSMDDPKKYPYHFGYQSANDQNYASAVRFMKTRGVRTLAFIASNDALGTYNRSAIENAVKGTGIKLVAQSYDSKATDLTAPLDALRSARPDLLLASGYGPAVGYILDARQKLNWSVPVIGDSGFAGSNPASLVDSSALKDVLIQTFKVAALSERGSWQPATERMVKAVAAKGPVKQIITLAAEPYDALQVLGVAAEQAGGTDPADLKKAMESLKRPSPVPWTTYAAYAYSTKAHFPVVNDSDFSYLPASVLVQGQFEASS